MCAGLWGGDEIGGGEGVVGLLVGEVAGGDNLLLVHGSAQLLVGGQLARAFGELLRGKALLV